MAEEIGSKPNARHADFALRALNALALLRLDDLVRDFRAAPAIERISGGPDVGLRLAFRRFPPFALPLRLDLCGALSPRLDFDFCAAPSPRLAMLDPAPPVSVVAESVPAGLDVTGGTLCVVLSVSGWGSEEPLAAVSAVRLPLREFACVDAAPLGAASDVSAFVCPLAGAVISGSGGEVVAKVDIACCIEAICCCIAIIMSCIFCICCC